MPWPWPCPACESPVSTAARPVLNSEGRGGRRATIGADAYQVCAGWRRAHLLAPRGVAAGGGGLRGGRGRARVAWPAGRPLRERWPGTPAMSLPDGKRLRSAVNHVAEMSHIIAAKWAVGNKLLNTYSNNFANEEEQEVRVRAAPRRAAEEPGRARRGSGRSGARAGAGPRLSADSAGAAGPASPMPSRLEQLKGRAELGHLCPEACARPP